MTNQRLTGSDLSCPAYWTRDGLGQEGIAIDFAPEALGDPELRQALMQTIEAVREGVRNPGLPVTLLVGGETPAKTDYAAILRTVQEMGVKDWKDAYAAQAALAAEPYSLRDILSMGKRGKSGTRSEAVDAANSSLVAGTNSAAAAINIPLALLPPESLLNYACAFIGTLSLAGAVYFGVSVEEFGAKADCYKIALEIERAAET